MTGREIPLVAPRRRLGFSPTRSLDRLSEGRFALVVATPGLLLVGVFVLPPILAAMGMSFFRIELLRDDFTPFIGFRNYAVRLPADSEFLATLPLTLGFAVLTSAFAVPVALAAAILIHGRARFAGLLALVIVLPWAIAPIAEGILWRLMFEPRTGVATYLLAQFRLPPVPIRQAPGALIAMGVAVTWRAIPFLAVLFLGALRGAPADIRRAAKLDGASGFQAFRYVTLPVIAPVVIAACLVQVILTVQVFEVQYALSAGVPPKGSLLSGHAIFNSVIGEISLGYGSAMAMVLGLFTALCLGGLYLVVFRPRATVRPSRRRRSARRPARSRESQRLVPASTKPNARSRGSTAGTARSGSEPSAVGDPGEGRRATAPKIRLGPVGRWSGGRPRGVAGRTDRVDGHRKHAAPFGIRPDAPAAHDEPRLSGYWRLVTDPVWQGAAVVSITVAVLGTLIALGVALLAGYPLARFRIRGGSVVLLALLATMLIPPIALAIPILFLVINLGIRDTVLGLVLINAAFWSPILIWLVRGAFMGVPAELERAARIDGCSRLGAIFRVSLPAAVPVIAAATAIVFIGIWNDFVFAAVVGGLETHTLPRYLGETTTPLINDFAARMVLTVAPCLALVALLRTRILALH